MSEDNIVTHTSENPDMVQAFHKARATFKYFWREISWEKRRIIPGLALALVKVAFAIDQTEVDDIPTVEHMWVDNVDFNGKELKGNLQNEPQWIKTLKVEDQVTFELSQISDWMYCSGGKVYGAFVINALRSTMSTEERKAHDVSWGGLDFGDPNTTEVISKSGEETRSDEELMKEEHPMCVNMQELYRNQLNDDSKAILSYRDDYGNSLLHSEALSGNALIVKILLEFGADSTIQNQFGQTPVDLANIFEWEQVRECFKV